ncbi:uncharacterized protein LOC129767571 isoform X2 [Toxorhynchites rutilus septentrionalis]|uniref:uncharacterized protein LOC129767571 isoform X2 n=1 Tax=Toxorhynchites rutilus septentrionalis TaxID=329112 RepID=UPI00247A9AAB|nr:uncharacterized protein LOC129767571 isoform X2 [Toxorhynchites rutilus septentrionalis]
MNRVMRSYTPDFKPSRKSVIGTPSLEASSELNERHRRRYSVSAAAGFTASVSKNVETFSPKQAAFSDSQKSSQESTPSAKAKNLRESLLLKILSTPVDQPLSLNDSDASDASFYSLNSTPVPSEELLESDDLLRCTTPIEVFDCQNNPRLARLYRDLQSPSAATRIRALRALKSPSKRDAYGNFDVPLEEQDIITEEERKTPQQKTIQDVMVNVCVYVEVRSGADNRSDGIKDHVASLGARVNEKLYKDTTHVVFKDGLLSTYQKAKKMNIPVVSILWIEACKRHNCLMNPEGFPISNLERYENPELFKKIRRQKSMQPRAEEAANSSGKKRAPLNAAVPGVSKLAISPPSRLPVLHRLRKDDGLEKILNEFQAENESAPEPQDDFDKLLAGPMRLLEKFRNSPAPTGPSETDKLEAFSEVEIPATPDAQSRNIRKSLFDGSMSSNSTREGVTTRRRSVSVNKDVGLEQKLTPTPRQRRKTALFTPKISSLVEEVESPVSVASNATKKRKTICSPKAMEICKANSVDSENMQENIAPSNAKNRATIYSPTGMEQSSNKTDKIHSMDAVNARKTLLPTTSNNVINGGSGHKAKTPELDPKELEVFRTNRRRTLYTPGVYDEADKKDSTKNSSVSTTNSTNFNPEANSTTTDKAPTANNSVRKRRTLYTPGASSEHSESPKNVLSIRRQTMFTHNDLDTQKPSTNISPASAVQKRNKTLLEEYQTSLTFSSTKTPVSERRKTIFDISMDIIDKRLSCINMQSKQQNEDGKDGRAASVSRSESMETALKSPPPRLSSMSRQTSLDTFYRQQTKSTEKTIRSKSSVDIQRVEVATECAQGTLPRKRRLFNAQPSVMESPAASNQDSNSSSGEENPKKRTKASNPGNRRSLAVPQTAPKPITTTTKNSRRSTMLFETQLPSSSHQLPARPIMGTQARTMKALGLGAGLPTVASQHLTKSARRGGTQYHLATTNLHATQHAFVKEVISTLGGFLVESNVSDRTTHLISLEPRRTLNLLRALIRGLWIITYEWIVESNKAGRWLSEEQFEMRNFSPAVQVQFAAVSDKLSDRNIGWSCLQILDRSMFRIIVRYHRVNCEN